ncbi:Multidrug resistance-associated protein 4 [Kappamyces sp. JEL0680]|nr:Multidrug resistance-associated protein 4 [Kappamyces sp. JEL0680]
MKIGVVGRTGAGKSSLLQALFRIVEPSPSKSIVLDGFAISELGLRQLRSSLSIIPQDPFCFIGTIRSNLDPFGEYTDQELWNVLEAVELKAVVSSLEVPVAENGSNWSVGERQLICLARAILRNSKVLVLDEATSSVDPKTDQLIQKAIRSEGGLFAGSTVLTIAHRLFTVIDYDMILVLDQGQVQEFGPPSELLDKERSRPDAWFARMVDEMGPEAREEFKRLLK